MLRLLSTYAQRLPALTRSLLVMMPPGLKQWIREKLRQAQARSLVKQASVGRPQVSENGAEVEVNRALEPGVNIVGLTRAYSGLGEYLRGGAKALDQAGVPLGLLDTGGIYAQAEGDLSLESWQSLEAKHQASLYYLPGDHWMLAYDQLGKKQTEGRYQIFSAIWELEHFPRPWLPILNRVDEVWAISRFIAEHVSRVSTVPVLSMPVAITATPPGQKKRADFGLPDGDCLFFFSFDMSSMTARKNPQGAIRAFQQAFGRKETGVGLVLKCTRVAGRSDQAKALEALQALTANDPRIHWVDRVLIRGDILDLMHCCDSFVSLHRAEGFGMGIAEAMLMGKPVIVTNYSGNTEFTRYGNSCLVDYTLIPVQAGEYPFHEGQHWASPDLEQAAHWMRKIADDPGFASTIGARARKVIAKEYGLEVVGQKMRERLEFLGLLGR